LREVDEVMDVSKIGKWCVGLALASAALWFADDGVAEPMLVVSGTNQNTSCIFPPAGQEYWAEGWGYSNNVKICEVSQRVTTNGQVGGGLCRGQAITGFLTPTHQRALITARNSTTRAYVATRAQDDLRPFFGPSFVGWNDRNSSCPWLNITVVSRGSDVPVTP
jgi:hypothetical protein